jgi:plastocyanin
MNLAARGDVRWGMRRSAILTVLLCCATVFGLAACSSSSSKSSGSTDGAAVSITNLVFSTSAVKAGATVTVKNNDAATHTVTADNGEFDVNVPANGHATFTAPSKAGQYKFHCNIHTSMHGTLDVS